MVNFRQGNRIKMINVIVRNKYQIGTQLFNCVGYEDQIHKLKLNDLLQHFDVIVISGNLGVSKPDKDIFRIACQQANSNVSDCIYVGNSYELDYLGSLNSGMKAIWLNRKSTDNNSYAERIHSLEELANHHSLRFCPPNNNPEM